MRRCCCKALADAHAAGKKARLQSLAYSHYIKLAVRDTAAVLISKRVVRVFNIPVPIEAAHMLLLCLTSLKAGLVFAVFRCLLNGWTTSHRMHENLCGHAFFAAVGFPPSGQFLTLNSFKAASFLSNHCVGMRRISLAFVGTAPGMDGGLFPALRTLGRLVAIMPLRISLIISSAPPMTSGTTWSALSYGPP